MGTYASNDVVVTVDDVAPTIVVSGDPHVYEGSTYTLSLGAITDPGTDAITSYSIDWGDGTTPQTSAGDPSGQAKTHVYANGPNGYTITISLTDEDGTHAGTGSLSVTVDNVAPDFEAGPDDVVAPAANGSFGRAGLAIADPGTADTFSGTVDFGDGSSAQALVIDQAARTFDLTHLYPHAITDVPLATYTVTIVVSRRRRWLAHRLVHGDGGPQHPADRRRRRRPDRRGHGPHTRRARQRL